VSVLKKWGTLLVSRPERTSIDSSDCWLDGRKNHAINAIDFDASVMVSYFRCRQGITTQGTHDCEGNSKRQ
jgi:hypothetical protein